MTDRTLTINISSTTLSDLQESGFHLYAFRPVTSSNKSGVPLVWERLDTYLKVVILTFTYEDLWAYISSNGIAIDTQIAMGNHTEVSRGERVSVGDGGGLTVTTGGVPKGDVYIAGAAGARYTCGLAAAQNKMPAQPFCAFTLSQTAVTMQPADAIFVMWATSNYDPAVYMQQSLGPGLFVKFGDAAQRTVSYDTGKDWQPTDAKWAQSVVSGTDLKTTLILNPRRNQPTR